MQDLVLQSTEAMRNYRQERKSSQAMEMDV